jgi:hypothetical protein
MKETTGVKTKSGELIADVNRISIFIAEDGKKFEDKYKALVYEAEQEFVEKANIGSVVSSVCESRKVFCEISGRPEFYYNLLHELIIKLNIIRGNEARSNCPEHRYRNRIRGNEARSNCPEHRYRCQNKDMTE